MAGNKALQKFKDSKIPKKGKGKITIEIPIYESPYTSSKIIGYIPKNKEITWISKSVCDEREWIRCNQDYNFGYIVGYEKEGNCNLDIKSIKEKKEEIKFDTKPEIVPLTKEEINLGNQALEEILNNINEEEKSGKSNNDNNESKTNNSTEIDENNKSDLERLDDDKSKTSEIHFNEEEFDNWDDSFENDISKIDFFKEQNDKLINEIKCQLNEESINNINKDNNNDDMVSQAINSVMDEISKEDKGSQKEAKRKEKIKENEELCKKIHDASEKKTKEERQKKPDKDDKYKSKKQLKKEEKDKNHVLVDGKIVPRDFSSYPGTFNPAMKDAKRLNNIPENAQPEAVYANYDLNGNLQKGYVYVYRDIHGNKVILRDDRSGHVYEDGYEIPPHINDLSGRHFFYNGEGNLHNLPPVNYEKVKGINVDVFDDTK